MRKRDKQMSRAEANEKYGQGKQQEEVPFDGCTQEDMAEAIRRAAAEMGGTIRENEDGAVIWETPDGGTIASVLVVEEEPSFWEKFKFW